MNAEVDWFFENESHWQKEYNSLRKIVLECEVNETLKWGCPCYTVAKSNIFLIHGFKEYCAILFMQGALIDDKFGILVHQSKNVQAARQLRFTNTTDILQNKSNIIDYIHQAIAIQKAGIKVVLKKTNEYPIPSEFQSILDEMTDIKTAFEALTPGRQKGYIFYFSSAKQSKTRVARIEKYLPKILAGKGLED